jgi:hypothetical protein
LSSAQQENSEKIIRDFWTFSETSTRPKDSMEALPIPTGGCSGSVCGANP